MLIPIRVYREGIWFNFQRDIIAWFWPWRRIPPRKRWFSSVFYDYFDSLLEIKQAWEKLRRKP